MSRVLFCVIITCFLFSCKQQQYSRNTNFFKKTKAYELAKAVERGDTFEILKLVKKDSTLLEFPNPISGSNVLMLCLFVEQYESFKKLLELGANPNFINLDNKHSVLIEACRFFDTPEPFTIDNRYAALLLDYGADPNYAVEEDFENEKQHYKMATSPLMEASRLDVELVKLLIKHGADPYKKLKEDGLMPFSSALRGYKNRYDIVDYFIDSLKVDVHQPLRVRKKDCLFIQDYVVNKFCYAKLMGDSLTIRQFKREVDGIEEANEKQWELLKKLEAMGVDFKNYDYKLNVGN